MYKEILELQKREKGTNKKQYFMIHFLAIITDSNLNDIKVIQDQNFAGEKLYFYYVEKENFVFGIDWVYDLFFIPKKLFEENMTDAPVCFEGDQKVRRRQEIFIRNPDFSQIEEYCNFVKVYLMYSKNTKSKYAIYRTEEYKKLRKNLSYLEHNKMLKEIGLKPPRF